MSRFSHTDDQGNASMVDVSGKPPMRRVARASGFIRLQADTLKLVATNLMKKGAVLQVAQVAGIQAAKATSSLIPLCHPLQLGKVDVELKVEGEGISCMSRVVCIGRTGVEMEALTAVSVALLTVYDMCKAVDKQMRIDQIELIEKTKETLVVTGRE